MQHAPEAILISRRVLSVEAHDIGASLTDPEAAARDCQVGVNQRLLDDDPGFFGLTGGYRAGYRSLIGQERSAGLRSSPLRSGRSKRPLKPHD